jgi:hypothetical protein
MNDHLPYLLVQGKMNPRVPRIVLENEDSIFLLGDQPEKTRQFIAEMNQRLGLRSLFGNYLNR